VKEWIASQGLATLRGFLLLFFKKEDLALLPLLHCQLE
jgi:hypothetical protein